MGELPGAGIWWPAWDSAGPIFVFLVSLSTAVHEIGAQKTGLFHDEACLFVDVPPCSHRNPGNLCQSDASEISPSCNREWLASSTRSVARDSGRAKSQPSAASHGVGNLYIGMAESQGSMGSNWQHCLGHRQWPVALNEHSCYAQRMGCFRFRSDGTRESQTKAALDSVGTALLTSSLS